VEQKVSHMPLIPTSAIRPTFLFIGADRCGSKWLHNVLRQHPNVLVPEIADPYFFDRVYNRGWEWYSDLFGIPDAGVKAIGELSHDYIFSAEAAERISRDLPEVKIVTTIRQPFSKSYSAFRLSQLAGHVGESYDEELLTIPWLLDQVLYYRHLKTYFDLFPHNQIKVMIYDDLAKDPRKFAKDIFDFIGVDLVNSIPYEQVFNAMVDPRFKYSGVLARRLSDFFRTIGAEQLLGKLKSDLRVRGVFYRGLDNSPRAVIGRKVFTQLVSKINEDIDNLSSLIGKDLSFWKHHEHYVSILEDQSHSGDPLSFFKHSLHISDGPKDQK
jgi:hypothetical protein